MPQKDSTITFTDQFCGAGGSSTAAIAAGLTGKMALNHWDLAIETHNTNHPNMDHDCTDVQACDPRRYPSTDILITSPECTNHSIAKGQKRKHQNQYKLFGEVKIDPAHERSRATMWDVPRFAEYHDYNAIIVENVVDARRWRMWDAWLMAMHSLGYKHKSVFLNSMFFPPCPQSRDRMYVVFWKKGNHAPDLEYRPIAPCPKCGEKEAYQWWKKSDKKWGKYGNKGQYLYRCSACNEIVTPYYYASFNCIDWTIPGKRIGDRSKPLADNTMKRIQYGLDKYANQALLINTNSTTGISCRVTSVSSASQTHTGTQSQSLLAPFLIKQEHSKQKGYTRNSITDPIWAQTTCHSQAVVAPFIIEANRTGKARGIDEHISTILAGGNHHWLVANYSPGYTRPITGPTGTITTSDSHGLLSMPLIVENKGQSKSKSVLEPISTMTTKGSHGLLAPKNLQSFLSYYYSGSRQASNMAESIRTISTNDRASLITPPSPSAVKIEDCYYRMLKAHEIQKGMAFPDDYIILGNVKQKVKQLGNAVTPPVMTWLIQRVVDSLTK